MIMICMDIKKHRVKLKLAKQILLKIKKEKDTLRLPILLSKLNIEQLINNLYNNKQINKQVYNNLNKAITYKNDS